MNEPLIRQWQSRPPTGGWNLTYTIKDQDFRCFGSPYRVVEQIRKLQQINNIYKGDDLIWQYCNDIWRERDPARAIRGEKEGATIFEMAYSLAKEAVKAGKAIISGEAVITDKETAAQRLAICIQCEEFIEKSRRCGKCGCYLAFKKMLDKASCPLKKW